MSVEGPVINKENDDISKNKEVKEAFANFRAEFSAYLKAADAKIPTDSEIEAANAAWEKAQSQEEGKKQPSSIEELDAKLNKEFANIKITSPAGSLWSGITSWLIWQKKDTTKFEPERFNREQFKSELAEKLQIIQENLKYPEDSEVLNDTILKSIHTKPVKFTSDQIKKDCGSRVATLKKDTAVTELLAKELTRQRVRMG